MPGEFHGQRNLAGIVHGVSKSQTQLSDFYFRGGVFNRISCCVSSALNGHSLKMRGSISALPLLVLLLVFWIPKDPPPAQRCPHASYRDLSFRVTRLCTAIALARVRGTGCASGPPASHCRGFSPCGVPARLPHCRGFSPCGVRALRRQASVIALRGLSSCGAPAELPRGTWHLPGPGTEPVSPALAGGFLTTRLPGKPRASFHLN